MTYTEAKARLEDLKERLAQSAADLQKTAPAVSNSREQDAQAIGIVLAGLTRVDADECPTCGV